MNRYSPGYLLTTNSEVYRCVGQPMAVLSTWATNTNASLRQFYLQHVPADASPDDEFSLIFDKNLAAKTSSQFDSPILLNPGEAIYARASAVDSVVLTMYLIPYGHFIQGRV